MGAKLKTLNIFIGKHTFATSKYSAHLLVLISLNKIQGPLGVGFYFDNEMICYERQVNSLNLLKPA